MTKKFSGGVNMKTAYFATAFAAIFSAVLCTGCWTHHEIKTESEIKPVHITIDVNVKVDKALDDYFSDLDDAAAGQ